MLLDGELTEVAADVDWTAGELANTLLTDDSLFVTDDGHVGFADVAPGPGEFTTGHRRRRRRVQRPHAALAAGRAVDDLLGLRRPCHHDTEHTWDRTRTTSATIVSTPFDRDGNPGSLSPAEVAEIEAVWQIVAEDFAPFNVDVTTEDPGDAALRYTGAGDAEYGTRIVISPTDAWFGDGYRRRRLRRIVQVEHAGVRLLRQPRQLQVGRRRVVPRVRSHARTAPRRSPTERTYYSGHGAWGPIMGDSYSRELAQWSKGEYAGADHTTRTTWRCSPRTSDIASTITATPTPTATALAGTGETSGFVGADDPVGRVHRRRRRRRYRRPGHAGVDGVEPVRLGHDPQRAGCCRRVEHTAAVGVACRVEQTAPRLGRPRDRGRARRSVHDRGPAGRTRHAVDRLQRVRLARRLPARRRRRRGSPAGPDLPGQVRLTPIAAAYVSPIPVPGEGGSVRLAADGVLRVQVAGTHGVPADVTAAALNVTAVGPTAAGS